MESSGSRKSSGSEFQTVGEAWEEAARANCLRSRSRDDEEDAPETRLSAGRSEWTILAPGRNSQRGTGEPTRGGTCRRVGRSCTSPDFECQASVSCWCIISVTDDRYGSCSTSLAAARRTD